MAITQLSPFAPLVLAGRQTGVTVIPAHTQLTRLNYFDGKFLRAQDLQAEQRYLRSLVELSNRAGGFGVVHGFDVSLAGGDRLRLGAGLAIDPQGRVLMLPQEHIVSIQELIDRSREAIRLLQSSAVSTVGGFQMCEQISETPPPTALAGRDWWLLTIAHAEALCGEEDVYGKLCEEACVTATDRPYWLEGVVLRVTPLQLATPLAQSTAVALDRTHLRSLLASAYFADEARRVGSLISRAGLESAVWCSGAAAVAGNEVAIGVLVREGGSTVFLDEWIARRERIDAPPRRYWQWRMRMRPWDVYLAHILQFQCQLHDLFKRTPAGGEDDPCAQARQLVVEAAGHIETLASFYKDTSARIARMTRSAREKLLEGAPALAGNVEKLALFQDRLSKLTQAFQIVPQERLLINGGIVELPSAGYLPVVPGSTVSVNQQVRRMLGEGVDLRFCIVRPDFVAHALEEAQHMDRISLLEGLDHPQRKPKVDVLVPDGRIAPDVADTGRFYEMRLKIDPDNIEVLVLAASRLFERREQPAERATLATGAAADTAALLRAYLEQLTGERREEYEPFEYSGVARSQRETGGGIAFHYAGGTRAFILGPDRPAPQPAPTPAPVSDTIGNISTNQPTGAGTATISAGRLASVARLVRAGEVGQPQTRSSIWVSLEIERDPLQLTRGQSVRVKSECFVLITMELRGKSALAANVVEQPATRNFLLRLGFTGEFQVEQVAQQPGERGLLEARGVLSGELTISLRRDSAAQDNFSLFLSENVRVRRAQGDHGPAFQIEMPEPAVLQPLVAELEVQREWTSATEAQAVGSMSFRAPREAQASTDILGLRAAGQPPRLATNLAAVTALAAAARVLKRQAFRAWQTVNPAVREPAHPAHESAIRALRSIGTVLGSAKFADLAAARLFPAPAARSEGLTVLATLDWVLFHRRRDKVCEQEIPLAPIETRHYALYHVQLAGDQTVADLARLLQRTGAQAAGLPPLDFVQMVEFGAGIHAVVSPHVQVQASWRQDVGTQAGAILGGVIASRGVAAAEGERLAQERLESVVEVIGVVAPVDAHPDYAVLQRVPDALDVPSNDGVVILATRQAAVTNCHDVFGVPRADDLKLLVAAAQEGRLQQALAGSKTAQGLGKVNFTGNQAEQASLEAVKQKWNTLNFGNASIAAVAANSGNAAAATYPPQAAAILSALGGSGTPGLVQTPEQLPGCPAVTIVAGAVEARNALLIYALFDGGHIIDPAGNLPQSPMEFRNNVPQGDALKNFVASLTPNQPVRRVTLATTKAAPDDPGAGVRMTAVLQELSNAGKDQTSGNRRIVQPLTEPDRKALESVGFIPDNFDEVIFFAPN